MMTIYLIITYVDFKMCETTKYYIHPYSSSNFTIPLVCRRLAIIYSFIKLACISNHFRSPWQSVFYRTKAKINFERTDANTQIENEIETPTYIYSKIKIQKYVSISILVQQLHINTYNKHYD